MKEIKSIYSTHNYNLFRILKGNRVVNKVHLERLKKSFKNKHLISPIIVNEKYEIIDGQTRFYASKEFGLPVYFFVVKEYGLNEVKIFNTTSRTWKKTDYLDAYCDLGYEEYIKMKRFMDDYPDFGIKVSEQLLTNTVGGVNNRGPAARINGKYAGKKRNFEEGNLIIENIDLAYQNADKIIEIKPYYNGYNRTTFVAAMIGMFKNKNYDNSVFVHKLKTYNNMMSHCNNVTQYKLLIENIYNYRNRQKVGLRY